MYTMGGTFVVKYKYNGYKYETSEREKFVKKKKKVQKQFPL